MTMGRPGNAGRSLAQITDDLLEYRSQAKQEAGRGSGQTRVKPKHPSELERTWALWHGFYQTAV